MVTPPHAARVKAASDKFEEVPIGAEYPNTEPENESADPACHTFFSAYGLSPSQFKWLAANRQKLHPSICPAPNLAMVDFVILFTHDSDTYNAAMPTPVHTDHAGFSDFNPLTTIDTALISGPDADRARREYVWVFRMNRGGFDPVKFSPRRRPQFSNESKGAARAIQDALNYLQEQATRLEASHTAMNSSSGIQFEKPTAFAGRSCPATVGPGLRPRLPHDSAHASSSKGRLQWLLRLNPSEAATSSLLWQALSRDGAEPHAGEAYHHAEPHVQSGHQKLAILEAAQRFVFERGESGIAADESDGNQVAPVGIPVGALGEQRDDEPDQKRAGAIDKKRSVGEARAEAFCAGNIRRPRSERTEPRKPADAHQPVFCHGASALSLK